MIFRFSLYGFLKNQRYFEPFLVLFFLDKGLSFTTIGLLVAFREATVNVLEIPSGAVADACGRRLSMILSFAAYVVSFTVFGFAEALPLFFAAMFFFAIGEAFRTGTHKAMIFEWLRLEGRTDERTRVYGYTRSWSQMGSALSGLLAAAIVLASGSYRLVFFLAAVPSALNIVNFLGYPKELDGAHEKARSPGEVVRHLREGLGEAFRQRPLRRLLLEAMGFEGVFAAVKDYLQPVLQTLTVAGLASIALGGSELGEIRRTALLVGPVYFVLYLLSALASRKAHRLAPAGGEERAARRLWAVALTVFGVLAAAAWNEATAILVAAFVVLHVLQNLWRPILITRFDVHSRQSQGATVLSIESQARRAATMVAAPLLGWAVDLVRLHGPGGAFWPLGALGTATALVFFVTARREADPLVPSPRSRVDSGHTEKPRTGGS